MQSKSGKHRIVTGVVLLIIFFMALILAYAPDGDAITGGTTADMITGYAVFSFPSGLDTRSGLMGITGFQSADGGQFPYGQVWSYKEPGATEKSYYVSTNQNEAFRIERTAEGIQLVSDPEGVVYPKHLLHQTPDQ